MENELKLDGAKILLNAPGKAEDSPPEDPPPPTKIELVDDQGRALPYQRFLVTLHDKSQVSGVTDKDGKVTLDLKTGGAISFPDLSDTKKT